MEIRKLTINDYEEMTALWTRANLPSRPRGRDSREAIVAQMEEDPEFFLGAFEDSRLVATVILSSDKRKGWINRLAVDPDYRRRGVAETLIAESEKTLGKCGLRIFCALIEDSNTPSKELFKKRGYVEHHDIAHFSRRCSDDV